MGPGPAKGWIMRLVVASALTLALVGCFSPPSTQQRLSDAAVDMNSATRFGRMDIAMEYVGAAARESFARRHAAWGGDVRVVDMEMGGVGMVEKGEAEVLVSVAWQRPADAALRVTRIAQRWREDKGRWQLVSESCRDGDPGLIDDPRDQKRAKAGSEAPAPAPFPKPSRVVIREQ